MTCDAGPVAAALFEQIEAVAVAEPDVGQHQVERLATQTLERVDVAGRGVPARSPGRGANRPSIPARGDRHQRAAVAVWSWRVFVSYRVRFRILRRVHASQYAAPTARCGSATRAQLLSPNIYVTGSDGSTKRRVSRTWATDRDGYAFCGGLQVGRIAIWATSLCSTWSRLRPDQ